MHLRELLGKSRHVIDNNMDNDAIDGYLVCAPAGEGEVEGSLAAQKLNKVQESVVVEIEKMHGSPRLII